MKLLNSIPIFLSSIFSGLNQKTKRIYINPKPRYIEELLKSKTIYFHAATGPLKKDDNDLLYKDIKVYCYVFGTLDENQECNLYVFTEVNDFYYQKRILFKNWLLDPENKLIFFNYLLNVAPFCELLLLKEPIRAQLLDVFMLCRRANNDLKQVELYGWFCEITNLSLPKIPENANWESRQNLISIKNQVKALCFLTDHFQKTNYEWINSHTGQKVNLLAYYQQYDQPLLAPIIHLMSQGLHIDYEKYERFIEENTKKETELATQFKNLFGIAYSRDIFYTKEIFKAKLAPETWNLPAPFPKTKKGHFSTSAIDLKAFRFKKNIQDKKLDLVIEIKEHLTKISLLKPFEQATNKKLYFNVKLGGTRTGRITTSAPNVQGISFENKELIVAPKGKIFLIMDLGQAELKIIAHLIQEPTMLSIFEQGKDIHSYFGAVLLKTSYNEFLELKETNPTTFNHFRHLAKTLNFSLLYDMSIKTLETKLIQNGIEADQSTATKFYHQWHDTFTGVKEYQKNIFQKFKKEQTGNVFTTYNEEFQLKSYLTTLGGLKQVHSKKDFSRRELSNFPVQGTCGEILKRVWIDILAYDHLGSILLPRFDEFIALCNNEEEADLLQFQVETVLEKVRQDPQELVNLSKLFYGGF